MDGVHQNYFAHKPDYKKFRSKFFVRVVNLFVRLMIANLLTKLKNFSLTRISEVFSSVNQSMSSDSSLRPLMLKGHERPLTQLKFCAQGDLLFSAAKDHHVSVWYANNGERLGTLEGHGGSVWSVDVTRDTVRAATAGADFKGKLWNVEGGKELFSWDFASPVKLVEFSPDNKKMFFFTDHSMGQTGTLHFFEHDLSAEKQQTEPYLQILNSAERETRFVAASWALDGSVIVTGHADGSVSKYDAVSGKLLQTERIFQETVTDIQMSKQRDYFICSSRDKTVCLVDVASFVVKKRYQSTTPVNSAVITPAKDFVIIGGGQDAKDVTTTSMVEGMFDAMIFHKIFEEMIGRIKGHFGPINALAIHPQGTAYASGGEDGYVRLHHFPKSYFDFQYDVEKTAAAELALANE